MTNYYQQPLSKEELKQYDNRTDVQYADTFNIKSPIFKSELYDKINLRRMSRQLKHTDNLRKYNLVINNAVETKKPLFN